MDSELFAMELINTFGQRAGYVKKPLWDALNDKQRSDWVESVIDALLALKEMRNDTANPIGVSKG